MSLPDQITLSVDEDNDGGTTPNVNHVYDRAEVFDGRSQYYGANHSVVLNDTLTFSRSKPKVNGEYLGACKSTAKFTKTIEVDGQTTGVTLRKPIILECSFSIPAGADPAEIVLARQKMVTLLDTDAIMDPLNEQLIV